MASSVIIISPMYNVPKISKILISTQQGNPGVAVASWEKCVAKTKKVTKGKATKTTISTIQGIKYRWTYWIKTADGFSSKQIQSYQTDTSNPSSLTFSIPEGATAVQFEAKPLSKEYTDKKNKKHKYWPEASSYTKSDKLNVASETPPETPAAPTVALIQSTKIRVSVSDLSANAGSVEFDIRYDGNGHANASFKTVIVDVVAGMATVEFATTAGYAYRARARAISKKNDLKSTWSEYSDLSDRIPSSVGGFTSVSAASSNSVQLKWSAVTDAEEYEINYVTDKKFFDTTTGTTITHQASQGTSCIIQQLEVGLTYYFRIRAKISSNYSAWYPSNPNDAPYVILGREPAPPSTYSLVSSVITGETAKLYWVHNAQDNSAQHYAILEFVVGTQTAYVRVENPYYEDEYRRNDNLFYELNTTTGIVGTTSDPSSGSSGSSITIRIGDGATIKWRVKTCGVTGIYGDWSVYRTINVYSAASLSISLSSSSGGSSQSVFTGLPIYVNLSSGPSNQNVLGYYISVVASESYTTTDITGATKVITEGQILYSTYVSSDEHNYVHTLDYSSMKFESGVSYLLNASVSLDSGLSASASASFEVSWSDYGTMFPTAGIAINDDLTATITPYCIDTSYDSEDYDEDEDAALYPGVILSVYRVNSDGSVSLVLDGIENNGTSVFDPHPTLGYVTYLIVAQSESTGEICTSEVSEYIDQPGIVLDWDSVVSFEERENIIVDSDEDIDMDEEFEELSYFDNEDGFGYRVTLPYNVDISENHAPDSELVEYIGRSRAVGYYGTQLGESLTAKAQVPKPITEDLDEMLSRDYLYAGYAHTMELLRRLATYTGDVYFRDASNRHGFWANVTVSIDSTHAEKFTPVTLSITPVEGGA